MDIYYENEEIENEEYEFITPVNRRLSEILEITPQTYDEEFEWDIPNEYGLSNCNSIIPEYYKRPENQILNINYYDIIKDDIRNCRPLNKYQLDYIFNLEDKHKNELFIIFNDCMKLFNDCMKL
jgi:hypothetical protein